ncbi:hypothetical protein OEZ86_006824 [Tetradesmus obliquus]|nr:hypothetical protein OEZ86_006824 [Tetradesmus obliquus]
MLQPLQPDGDATQALGTITTRWHSSLDDIDLCKNRLTGSIPAELLLVDLRELDLSFNALDGPLPPFGGTLRVLRLGNNSLSGQLPDQLGSWAMSELDFSNNRFEGTLPCSLGSADNLAVMRLNGNSRLLGTLPEQLVLMPHLALLDARGTSMQEPKRLAASSSAGNSALTAVPRWMEISSLSAEHLQHLEVPGGGAEQHIPATCPVVGITGKDTTLLLVDPYYYQFVGCVCQDGYTSAITETNNSAVAMVCKKQPSAKGPRVDPRLVAFLVGAVVVVGAAALGTAVAFVWVRKQVVEVLRARRRRALPPQVRMPVTLVSTDIAGSTELWEWDTQQAAEAVDLHDKVLRQYLSDFGGYEVTTEGDAFLVAFHDPAEAVGYCLTVQLALQDASWNEEVLGLRVRMAVASGIADGVKLPKVTRRVEYNGTTMRRVQAVGDAPEGGQVVIDGETFKGITANLPQLGERVAEVLRKHTGKAPDQVKLGGLAGQLTRSASLCGSVDGKSAATGFMVAGGSSDSACKACMADTRFGSEVSIASSQLALQHHHLRSAVSSISSLLHPFSRSVSSTGTSSRGHSEQHAQQRSEHHAASGNDAAASRKARRQADRQLCGSVLVLDMGLHKLPGVAEAVQLVSVLPPVLEGRAHCFPALNTLQQHTPGYLDAPATHASPLHVEVSHQRSGRSSASRLARSVCPLPPVVMVFCAVDGYRQMSLADRPAAQEMLQHYSDVVRWTLLVAGGYECQEQEGNYMIAFHSAATALEWALLLQEALMEVNWSNEVLALPGAEEVVTYEHGCSTLHFRGPRVRIGLYRGIPTRVVPHTTTGRADYFGCLVNRAARYCHTAAHGGQVVAPRELVEELITSWCGVCPAHLPEEQGPPWVLLAEPRQDEQGTACWARAPGAFAPSTVNCSMAGRASDCAAGGVGDDPVWGPVGGCYLRRSSSGNAGRRVSNTAADPGTRRQSSCSSVHTCPCTPSAAAAAAAACGTPTGRIGSNSSMSGAPMASGKSFTGKKLGRSSSHASNAVPDMSALYTMRRVAVEQAADFEGDTSNSSSSGRTSVRHCGVGPAAAAGPAASPAGGTGAAGNTSRGGGSGGAVGRSSKKDRGSRIASSPVHGMRRFSAGWDIDCGLAAALYARLVLHKWSWADTLMVHDLGEFTFKGISGSHSLVSVCTKALAGRSFPHALRKAKGTQLTRGQGLLYQLHMQAAAVEGASSLPSPRFSSRHQHQQADFQLAECVFQESTFELMLIIAGPQTGVGELQLPFMCQVQRCTGR